MRLISTFSTPARRTTFGLFPLCVFLLTGCGSGGRTVAEPLTELRIGILPDQATETLNYRYGGLIDHLEDRLGVPVRMVVPQSYNGLLELFISDAIDLAYFGGYTFLRARAASGALPLVMRDIDLRLTSYFLVRSDNPASGPRDLAGRTFSFGDSMSTSGHIMPRFYLGALDIAPEAFFSEVRYSGAHDKTVEWVMDGTVTAGVVNGLIVEEMFREGRLSRDSIRVLWETPHYPGYVWAVRPVLDRTTRLKIRDAFLELTTTKPEHGEIIKRLGAGGFIPASDDDFLELTEAVASLGTPAGGRP